SVTNLAIFGTDAAQRGRRSCAQVCVVKSNTKTAVSFASSLAGLSWGAAGTFTDAHSSMMVCAHVGFTTSARTKPLASKTNVFKYCMNFSPNLLAKAHAQIALTAGLVPLFDLRFLNELAAVGVGTSNRRHECPASEVRDPVRHPSDTNFGSKGAPASS